MKVNVTLVSEEKARKKELPHTNTIQSKNESLLFRKRSKSQNDDFLIIIQIMWHQFVNIVSRRWYKTFG